MDNCIINEIIRKRELSDEHQTLKNDLVAFRDIVLSVEADDFVMSPHSKEEFSNTPRDSIREELLGVYDWLNKVSASEHGLLLFPAPPGTPSMLPGGLNVVFPKKKVLKDLEGIFSAPDAKHIFQAVQGKCTHFLTIDYSSILNRVPSNREKLSQICPNLKILSPKEFCKSI